MKATKDHFPILQSSLWAGGDEPAYTWTYIKHIILCTFFIDFELMNSAYSHEQAIMLELYSSKSYAYICHINMVGWVYMFS